jgi:hypothetical protein
LRKKMRTISHKDLPNSSLKSVGIVPLSDLFPIETYLKCRPRAYIHYDGGLIRFFKMKKAEIAKISKMIRALPEKSAMQIYKHHTPSKDTFYIAFKKDIEYNGSPQTWIFRGFSPNPVRKTLFRIQELMDTAYASLSRVVAEASWKTGNDGSAAILEEVDYLDSELPGMLLDGEIHDLKLSMSSDIRTNLSIIKIGTSRYATIASLNNMAVIPHARGCLEDKTYLERILVASPSRNRRRKIQSMVIDNGKMIQTLAGEFGKSRNVHVDTIIGDVSQSIGLAGKILYADVAFMLYSDSTEDLSIQLQGITERMEGRNIALYCHTNTTKATFISMFPGNEVYAERYSLLFEYYLNMLIMNVLEL